MATTSDLDPFVYNFRYSYYENFYRNRQQLMSSSGSYFGMYVDAWDIADETRVLDDGLGIGAVTVNHGVNIEQYVKKHYNGATPECLADKVMDNIDYIISAPWAFTVDLGKAIADAVDDFFDSLSGSFICTATVETLGTSCGLELLGKLKKYRDDVLMDEHDGVQLLRYYGVLGPRIVHEISKDPDKEMVYKYLYSEYISRIEKLMETEGKFAVFVTYFEMVNEMVEKYEIPVGKGYEKWRQNLKY